MITDFLTDNQTIKIPNIKSDAHFGYNAPHGLFFIFNPITGGMSEFRGCREEFSHYFKRNTRFVGFRMADGESRVELFKEFFEYIENRLKLKTKTIIYKTNHKNTVILDVAPFWRTNSTTRGMLTLFIRCAGIHYDGNFKKAIHAYYLTNQIPDVIEWFLDGHTQPTYKRLSGGGVVYFFRPGLGYYDCSEYDLRDYKTLLVKPTQEI